MCSCWVVHAIPLDVLVSLAVQFAASRGTYVLVSVGRFAVALSVYIFWVLMCYWAHDARCLLLYTC